MSGSGDSSGGSLSIRGVICNAGAGAAAGAIAATFVCPLDVIKTRLQVLGLPETPAGQRGGVIVTSLQSIIKNEGFRGLYRGLSPTIIALLPNWAVYFTVYGKLKDLLQSSDGKLSVGANMIAAAGAGASTAIATNPFWVVKTRLMTQGMRPDVVPYKSILSAFSRICHEEGFRGLYSGILPSLAGISHVAIQFPAYEKIKQHMAKIGNTSVDKLSPGDVAIASSVSKVIASVMTYPHEVVRSKLQEQGQLRNPAVQYSGVVDCVKKVLRKEGIPGFYRGCATNLLRTTPSAVITFTSYEMIHRFLLRAVPSDRTRAKTRSEEDTRTEDESLGNREEGNKDLGLRESQTQSNKINTSSIPLGNK
ncbi:PREDICTED: nicotinamide adenine dinucleotide transporter 2, mitochondrial-like [Tarenaya hassleriana]|uniref:nicotinamide adenine dinucleotide transporter 2, mitochondrial-like n=1 Tax=Tarenaya hassleriana TaxID=28532 RepID=UPI00053C9770|nr:PREDICTED: nicotinamide adenine dinucleotide transporter 2, mitochondrial-like [Tarenaya hassleriana]